MNPAIQELEIKVGEYSPIGSGYVYTLFYQGVPITSHFCSNDFFAHSDLFRHPEINELIGDMEYDDFKQIPINYLTENSHTSEGE